MSWTSTALTRDKKDKGCRKHENRFSARTAALSAKTKVYSLVQGKCSTAHAMTTPGALRVREKYFENCALLQSLLSWWYWQNSRCPVMLFILSIFGTNVVLTFHNAFSFVGWFWFELLPTARSRNFKCDSVVAAAATSALSFVGLVLCIQLAFSILVFIFRILCRLSSEFCFQFTAFPSARRHFHHGKWLGRFEISC